MLFALARNWVEHDRMTADKLSDVISQAYPAAIKDALNLPTDQFLERLEAIKKVLDPRYKRTLKEEKSLRGWIKCAEFVSLIAMLAGFVLLLVFAGKSVFALTS